MLKQLYIRNFALIDILDIQFHEGFSAITGETGAGKSIILGAIGLLLGNRADSKLIKKNCDKCIVEAHFDLSKYDFEQLFMQNDIDFDAKDCIIRREINTNGKSRAFINDTPVSLTLLKELGIQLIDIHSQHQNLLLQKEDFQLNVVDILADNRQLLADYKVQYQAYQCILKDIEALKVSISQTRENEEFIRFRFNEINVANLREEEQEILESSRELMSHTEDIKTALFNAESQLNSEDNNSIEPLRNIADQLHHIEEYFPIAKDLAERLDTSIIELKDIAEEISGSLDRIEFNPEELQRVNERLDTIYSLQQKFHVDSISGLFDIRDKLESELNNIEHSEEQLTDLQKKAVQQLEECTKLGKQLTTKRSKTAKVIEEKMKDMLVPLGIPNVRFEVQTTHKALSSDGADKVSFLFSANKSSNIEPLTEVASGGEIARVMLSLKAMISGAVKLPTIIFDEIDTGVSGKVASQMAQIMYNMGASNRQVISITHLPQIAARGIHHYKVSKEETVKGTISHMAELGHDERINEIAQMLSGNDITPAAIENAKNLLMSN